MAIVACQCGARIRVPDNPGRRLRCPRCKQELVMEASAAQDHTVAAGDEQAGKTCPICQTVIDQGERVLACPGCGQVHHHECWTEIGGCATYGCVEAHATDKPTTASTPVSAWGDTKVCPICGERIKAIALRCRYCGADFDSVDPLTVADLHRRVDRRSADAALRRNVIALFIFGAVGLVAPIVLIVALKWFLPRRQKIAQAGPVYPILGYTSLVLSVIYSLVFLFFIIRAMVRA